MKLIVRYYDIWGKSITKGFEFEADATVDSLKEAI